MIHKPGTLKERYLPNEANEWRKWFVGVMDLLSVLGTTTVAHYSKPAVFDQPSYGIVHICLKPESKSHQNITVHTKMLEFRLDYYNVAIHPNCCLNQIDIFIQFTFAS